MTAPKRPARTTAAPRPRTYTQAELDRQIADAREAGKQHGVKGQEMAQSSTDRLAEKVADKVAGKTPGFFRVGGPAVTMVLGVLGIIGIIGGIVMAPVLSRISGLEASRTELAAALLAVNGRMQGNEAKTVEISTQFNTATRLRDQQQQATLDRIRGLELSDQAGSQQINTLAQSLAGLVARMEEMLRRQERLENRLSLPMPRPGAEDAPAVAISPAPHV